MIPVFNEDEIIEQCVINSLETLSKYFIDYEMIIVDDGSTDDTVKIIDNIADKRINLIYLTRVGRTKALNTGIKNSKGKYLFLLPGSPSACKDGWDQIIKFQLNPSYKPCNLVEILPKIK